MNVTEETVSLILSCFETKFQLTELEAEYIKHALLVENYQVPTEAGLAHIVDNVGKFKGLGQFSHSTWRGLIDNGWDLPPYAAAVCSPWWDLLAILFLMRDNQKVFQRQFKRSEGFPDVATAYLYHNQGAGTARDFLRGTAATDKSQSLLAQELFRNIDRSEYV